MFSCLLSQNLQAQTDSLRPTGTVISVDSLISDSSQVRKSNQLLKYKVARTAEDSTINDIINKQVHLYGNAVVTYQDIVLKAAYIRFDLNTSTVHAFGMPDSTGKIVGKPEFQEGGKNYRAEEIQYNFNSQKGKINTVITEEGDGYVHGEKVKKVNDSTFYIAHGKYTTCENDHPHFYIGANKLKIIPGKKIVTGPAYLVLQDVYTPLVIPFGFFPTQEERSSGILFPTYGESAGRGFFLRDGGYYWAINDKLDLAVRGDIYSRGSWALKAQSKYKIRYKFNGSFSLGRSILKSSIEGFPDYREDRDFFIKWNHNQDPKARPYSSFRANVNLGSSSYLANNATNVNDILTNTLQSSVSYAYSIPNSPFNLSVNLRHSQNNQSKIVNLSLPEMALTMNRIYPFKSKFSTGTPKWYEKIGVSYTMNAQNKVSAPDSTLFDTDSLSWEQKWQLFNNGMRLNIPVATNFKLFKYVNASPSFNYSESWYAYSIRKSWDSDLMAVDVDTVRGFHAARQFSTGISLNTRIYGLKNFRKGKLKAVRHVVSPTLGFSYRPDFSTPYWGYYDTYQSDSLGNTSTYSIFEGGIYGSPPSGKSGNINFGLANNLEIKLRTYSDSAGVGEKKVKLLEAFNVSGSYNLAVDSLNLSRISFNGRTQLTKQIDFKFSGAVDPYALDTAGRRINTFYWQDNKQLGRLTDASFSLTFNFRRDQEEKRSNSGTAAELDMINANPEQYVDFTVPWSLNMFYNVRYTKPGLSKADITQSLTFQGDLRLTPKWKIGFNSGYDFVNKGLTATSLDIYRDLHCWEMTFNWIPFGFRQSYMLTIRVKAPVLQDLKLNRRQAWYDF